MVKKIRKHFRSIYPLSKPSPKEILHNHTGNFPLNIAQSDRISFSVLKNEQNKIRKIENISLEINIEDHWEWIVRYDDHGGVGSLHGHLRISLKDNSYIESYVGIKKYRAKDFELTWVCKVIQKDYLVYRAKFLESNGLELY